MDGFGDSTSYHTAQGPKYYIEQSPTPAEEVLVVELNREAPHKLGLSIVGGADNPSLQEVHVKKVLTDGLVFKDGRIKRGDRIVSVNGQTLAGLTNKEALQLLKTSGTSVQLEVARRLGQRSQAPSPLHSQLQSRQSSGENTNEPPSPLMRTSRQRKVTTISGPPTPPSLQVPKNTLKGRSRRSSLSQADDEASLRSKPATMPRKLKSIEGVKIVELHKGPTGLGMNLKGGSDEDLPITVREVFPGGAAHRSGKIHPGDVIIEVNNESFESLTHKEALQKLKSYPQGKLSLLVRDRMATLPRKTIPHH
jgi:C-terminal processing protease CtpA/Prc